MTRMKMPSHVLRLMSHCDCVNGVKITKDEVKCDTKNYNNKVPIRYSSNRWAEQKAIERLH